MTTYSGMWHNAEDGDSGFAWIVSGTTRERDALVRTLVPRDSPVTFRWDKELGYVPPTIPTDRAGLWVMKDEGLPPTEVEGVSP